MPTHATARTLLLASRPGVRVAAAALCAGLAFPAATVLALPTSTSRTEREPARLHRHTQAKRSPETQAVQAPVAPEPPPAPPQPDWPVNDKPSPASVIWDSRGLRIDASNSSLDQILKEVSTDTGAKVEGLHSDQRIFGSYGPGPARDVLSQLLDGTGYNVLMIGDQGQGTPRQIVLSIQPAGTASAPANNTRQSMSEEDYDAEQEIRQQEMEQQQQQLREQELQQMRQQAPQPNNGGFQPPMPPGQPPRTPQQIIQQMQLEQQQQQQNNQQR